MQIEEIEGAEVAGIGGGELDGEQPGIPTPRCATEHPGRRIEAQPCGQRRAIRECRAIAQHIAHILIGKRVGRHHQTEGGSLRHLLIGHRSRHGRRVIHILHREREYVGDAETTKVGGFQRNVQIPHITVQRRAGERARRGVEAQPARQRGATSQRGAVGQHIAQILIGKRRSRHHQIEWRIFRRLLIGERRSHGRRLVDVLNCEREDIGDRDAAGVRRRHLEIERPDLRIIGCAAERPRRRIEAQPRGQRSPIRQTCRIGQRVARILIGEGVRWNHDAQRHIFKFRLIRDRARHGRRVIHVLHRQRECVGRAEPTQIRRLHREVQIPHVTVERCAGERPRRGIEAEPGRQRGSTNQRGAIGQLIPRVDIGECARLHHQIEWRIF